MSTEKGENNHLKMEGRAFKVYSGVTYTAGSMNLEEIAADSLENLLYNLGKIIVSEPDATSFVITIMVEDKV